VVWALDVPKVFDAPAVPEAAAAVQYGMELDAPDLTPPARVTVLGGSTNVYSQPHANWIVNDVIYSKWTLQFTATGAADPANVSLKVASYLYLKAQKTPETVRTDLKGSTEEWAQGVACGSATLKVSAQKPPALLPEVKQVWYLLAARSGNPVATLGPVSAPELPPEVLQQATAALGFDPILLDAQALVPGTQHLKQNSQYGVVDITKTSDQGIFTVHAWTELAEPYITGGFLSVFRFDGVGWAGAPVLAGPLTYGSEEIYVLYVAEGAISPALAQKMLAQARTWTASGHTASATFVKLDHGSVILRKADGTQVTVVLAVLSPDDQKLISEAQDAAPAENK
jgi:hypothetical protein